MTFLTNKKVLLTLGVGVASVVGLAALGIRSVSNQIEDAFSFLDDDFVDFDEDDLEDEDEESEEESELEDEESEEESKSPLGIFKR